MPRRVHICLGLKSAKRVRIDSADAAKGVMLQNAAYYLSASIAKQ